MKAGFAPDVVVRIEFVVASVKPELCCPAPGLVAPRMTMS
jgi:hypothetical protein